MKKYFDFILTNVKNVIKRLNVVVTTTDKKIDLHVLNSLLTKPNLQKNMQLLSIQFNDNKKMLFDKKNATKKQLTDIATKYNKLIKTKSYEMQLSFICLIPLTSPIVAFSEQQNKNVLIENSFPVIVYVSEHVQNEKTFFLDYHFKSFVPKSIYNDKIVLNKINNIYRKFCSDLFNVSPNHFKTSFRKF